MQAFPEQNSHGGRRLQPRGGALAGVLILCLTLAIASAMFVGVITASLSGAREYNAQAGADAAVRSAIEHAKGLLHADLLANAGGVTCSYFEQVQSNMNFFWDRDEVLTRLDAKMTAAFGAVSACARERNLSLRDGAYVIAVGRVAQACKDRGWV